MKDKKKKAAAPAKAVKKKEDKPGAAAAPAPAVKTNKALFVERAHIFKSLFSDNDFFTNRFKK